MIGNVIIGLCVLALLYLAVSYAAKRKSFQNFVDNVHDAPGNSGPGYDPLEYQQAEEEDESEDWIGIG